MDFTEIVDDLISKAKFDGQKSYYESHRNRYIFTLEALSKCIPAQRFLEIGSSGFFLKAMNALQPSLACFGTQYSETPGYVEEVLPFETEGEGFYFQGDPEKFSYSIEDSHFDLVLCAEVIEHMPVDPMALLSEMNRIIRPNGHLLVTTPNIASIRSIFQSLNHEMPFNFYLFNSNKSPDRHNIEYTPKLLSLILIEAGFEVVDLFTRDAWSLATEDQFKLLDSFGFSRDLRGDNIFCIAKKVGPLKNRYPDILYVQN